LRSLFAKGITMTTDNTTPRPKMPPGTSGEQPEESPDQTDFTLGGDKSGPGKPAASRTSLPLGRLVATPGALDLMERHRLSPFALLERHRAGDWSDVDAEDAQENALSLKYGLRVMSSYRYGPAQEAIWVITEADRSVTTLLLPSEY
jgi:hypothetical protein